MKTLHHGGSWLYVRGRGRKNKTSGNFPSIALIYSKRDALCAPKASYQTKFQHPVTGSNQGGSSKTYPLILKYGKFLPIRRSPSMDRHCRCVLAAEKDS